MAFSPANLKLEAATNITPRLQNYNASDSSIRFGW